MVPEDSPGRAAERLLGNVVARPWGVAVAVVIDGAKAIRLEPGRDPMTSSSMFEAGSVTKTIIGTLLAECVIRGEVSLDTTIADILGDRATGASRTTLLELATHTSGFPRLPPNMKPVDPANPYEDYTQEMLLESFAELPTSATRTHSYSNYGFMALGHLLELATRQQLDGLLAERVFEPLGMNQSRVAGDRPVGALPGYHAGKPTPWWTHKCAGAGGMQTSISDLARLAAASSAPDDTPLGSALRLAMTQHHGDMGLGWMHQAGGWFHHGETGGFRSFVVAYQPRKAAVAILANGDAGAALDHHGFSLITHIARDTWYD
ncbi:MAG: serine hydrolase domain-containing protein [Mycobacteriales bacterium]